MEAMRAMRVLERTRKKIRASRFDIEVPSAEAPKFGSDVSWTKDEQKQLEHLGEQALRRALARQPRRGFRNRMQRRDSFGQ
jgi:hypothetical protein